MDKTINIYAEVIEPEAMNQFYEAMAIPCNIQGALMPDTHAGYTLPIGAVIKSQSKVFPSYVGYDIGCGMCAVKLHAKVSDITTEQLKQIKNKIIKQIPLGPNKHKSAKPLPKRLLDFEITDETHEIMKNTGAYQIGTLGGGNHFIEFGADRDDFLNIVIHSGSRGVGYKIADHYMKLACVKDVDEKRYLDEFDNNPKNQKWYKHITDNSKDNEMEKYLKAREDFVYRRTRARVSTKTEGHFGFDITSEAGKNYLKDMDMALEFALENRKLMIDECTKAVKDVLNLTSLQHSRFINRNHNHAVVNKEDGTVVHRKGATHAEKGMLGVIPGNMKDGSFIVMGKGNSESMCSSSHGAGRVLSRRQAKDLLDYDSFHKSMEGIVTNHTKATLDEAPKAYKDIYKVMELQNDLVDVLDHVRPILNIKG